MKITEHTIPLIEEALDIQLYESQREYLVNNGSYWYGGRVSGKTLAYCIKLALSDGKPLNMRKPWEICDDDYGPKDNIYPYSRWFRNFFLKIWEQLKSAGLPVRDVIY